MTADELAAMIAEEIDNNSGTRAILAKVQRGDATLEDSERFTGITAEITGRLLADNVLSLPLSDRQGAFLDITAARYRDTFSVFSAVQRALDERLGINLAVVDPGFEKARAQKAGHALADQTVPESTVQRRAESAGENIVRSQHDRIVQKQAEFRGRAGLSCSAIREGGAKCCEWCASVSGKYPASDTPQGFWGRHDNCKCSILYETRKGVQRLGGSTKKWEPLEDAGAPEPTRLTQEQAAEREAQHPVIAFSPEQAEVLQANSQFRALIYDDKNIVKENRGGEIKLYRVTTSQNTVYISDGARQNAKPKSVHAIDMHVSEALKMLRITGADGLPPIYVLDSMEMGTNAAASYNAISNILHLSLPVAVYRKDNVPEGMEIFACFEDDRSSYIHELIHWQDAQKYRSRFGAVTDDNYSDYVSFINQEAKKKLDKLIESGYNIAEISDYAVEQFRIGRYYETYTEYRVIQTLKR